MIPSFATLALDGVSPETPFCNSLTVTRNDFSNFQHKDKDKIEIAYGMWWPAALHGDKRYVIDDNVGHEKVKGGAFLWGEYAVAVDFERFLFNHSSDIFKGTHEICRCDGLVEIYWRGKFDFHGTMASESSADTTRFGTSVQLTGKGTAAVARFWAAGGIVAQSTTPDDRMSAMEASLGPGRPQKKQRSGKGKKKNSAPKAKEV